MANHLTVEKSAAQFRFKTLARAFLIVLVCLSLVALSSYTAPKAQAEALTLSLTTAFLMLVIAVMSTLGVTLSAPSVDDGVDYLTDPFLAFLQGKGYSSISEYLASVGITAVSQLAVPVFGAINIVKNVYDIIAEFCSSFFASEGVTSGGSAVGEVGASVIPRYSYVNTSRFSFSDNVLSLVGNSSSNSYVISDGSLGGCFIPLTGWLSVGDTLDVTFPSGSLVYTSSGSNTSSSSNYYKSSVGYYIAQFVDSSSLVGGSRSSSIPHIHAGTNITGVTASDYYKSYYESYTVPHGTYYVGYYNSQSLNANTGVRSRTQGTYSITVPAGASYLFLGLGCGNYSSGNFCNGVAVTSNCVITLSQSASVGEGFVITPSATVIDPPAVATGQTYSVPASGVDSTTAVETAINTAVAPLTTSAGLTQTGSAAGVAVTEGMEWLYEDTQAIRENTNPPFDFIPSTPGISIGIWHYVTDMFATVAPAFALFGSFLSSLPPIVAVLPFGSLALVLIVALIRRFTS